MEWMSLQVPLAEYFCFLQVELWADKAIILSFQEASLELLILFQA